MKQERMSVLLPAPSRACWCTWEVEGAEAGFIRGSDGSGIRCCFSLFSEIRRLLSPSRGGRRLLEGAMKLCLLIDDMMEGLRDRREAECGACTSKNIFFPSTLSLCVF